MARPFPLASDARGAPTRSPQRRDTPSSAARLLRQLRQNRRRHPSDLGEFTAFWALASRLRLGQQASDVHNYRVHPRNSLDAWLWILLGRSRLHRTEHGRALHALHMYMYMDMAMEQNNGYVINPFGWLGVKDGMTFNADRPREWHWTTK